MPSPLNAIHLIQEFFLQAIRDLELEQLHAETARLQLSLYHLRRSQIQLEEFRGDPVCRAAIEDNEVVIKNQVDRVDLIRLEVERRGFSMEHGSGRGKLVNGHAGTESEGSLGPEMVMDGTGGQEAEVGAILTSSNVITSERSANAHAGTTIRGDRRGDDVGAGGEEEEEGIYL